MSKKTKVLEALLQRKYITARDGYSLGTNDVRKNISILRNKGHKIADEWTVNPHTKTRYKKYFIINKEVYNDKRMAGMV